MAVTANLYGHAAGNGGYSQGAAYGRTTASPTRRVGFYFLSQVERGLCPQCHVWATVRADARGYSLPALRASTANFFSRPTRRIFHVTNLPEP